MDCRQLKEPSEVEAWKTMMDSMIKFINAATKLMNTYNQKASTQTLSSKCVPQCPNAQNKPGRRCSANNSQPTAKNETKEDTGGPISGTAASSSPDEHVEEAPESGVDVTPLAESSEAEGAPESGVDETPLAESTGAENAPGDGVDETPLAESTGAENAPEDGRNVTPLAESTGIDQAAGKAETTEKPRRESKRSSKVSIKTENAGGDVCTCKEVKKTQSAMKEGGKPGKCGCGAKKSKPQLCACPVTSKEAANLTDSVAEKLEKAQGEIDGLKKELQKLQLMESTRKSNSAALYKEIMKETSLDPGPPFKSSTPMGQAAASRMCPTVCSQRQLGALPSTIRTDGPTLSYAPAPDARSYTPSGYRPMPQNQRMTAGVMQPLAASTPIEDNNPASRRSQPRQFKELAPQSLKTSYYSDDQPTQSGTSQCWNEYCNYYPDSDALRYPYPASSTPAYPLAAQYSEVECVYKRPKNTSQSPRIRPQATPDYYQGMMQAAMVCAPPKAYSQAPVYEDQGYDYGNDDEYEDQLCDDYSCGNDECENR